MVDDASRLRIEELRALKRDMGWTQADMARIADVSPQAAGKWFKQGKIGGQSLALLQAEARKRSRAGTPIAVGEVVPDYIAKGDEEVDRRTVEQIFDALPPAQRAEWIKHGHMLVAFHAPKGPANPIPTARPAPKRLHHKAKGRA